VPWHATPCAVDEDGDEWWERERERGRRPEQGGAYLVEEPDPAHRSSWWWRKGHLALDGDPPLRDPVEGHANLMLRVGLRVDLRERDGERLREDKDGSRPRVGIRPHLHGDKGGRFFSPSAW
jgi:hypothetical protein